MTKQKIIRILSKELEELDHSIGPVTYKDKAESILYTLETFGLEVEECYACVTPCGMDHCYFTDTGE